MSRVVAIIGRIGAETITTDCSQLLENIVLHFERESPKPGSHCKPCRLFVRAALIQDSVNTHHNIGTRRGWNLPNTRVIVHDCRVVIIDSSSGLRAWIYQELPHARPGAPRMHAAAAGRPRSTLVHTTLIWALPRPWEIQPCGYCKQADRQRL